MNISIMRITLYLIIITAITVLYILQVKIIFSISLFLAKYKIRLIGEKEISLSQRREDTEVV